MIDIQQLARGTDTMICVALSGRLTQKEYLLFGPHLESTIRHHEGLRLVFVLADDLRWEPRSSWRELRFDSRHRTSIARLAIVGGSESWQRWILRACQPLTVREAMTFPTIQRRLARLWSGAPSSATSSR